MGQDCCTQDPSNDRPNTEPKRNEGSSYNTASKQDKPTANGYSEAPEESQSNLNVPNNVNNNGYITDDVEESLNPPSRLDSTLDETGHEPLPPSDYEEEPDKYEDNNDNAPEPVSYDDDNNENDDTSNNTPNERVEEPQSNGYEEPQQNGYEEAAEPEEPPKPKHRQIQILENEDLRDRSVKLVTNDNNEFIKFLKKILKSKLNEKIWSKCDPNATGKIETEKFMYFWTLPVTLFKVAVFQRTNNTKEKPKLDQKELKKEFTHLATWIIRRYGERQDDGGSTFTLTKENFAKDIVDYVKKYAEVKGELYEDYGSL